MVGRMRPKLPVTLVAALAVAAAVTATAGTAGAAPNAAAAKKCGLYKVGNGAYLTSITKRRGVSCKKAKRVHRKALKNFGGDHETLCGERKSYRRWTIKPDGAPALAARYRNGDRRFHVSSQGSCEPS